MEKINKIDKSSARLITKKKKTINTTETQKIVREYYEQLYANKSDSLVEMDKFPETYNLLKLNQEEIDNLNRPITSSEIESIIKNSPS